MPIQNAEIAAMFDQTADLLELRGEKPFRVRTYRRAARTVDGLPQSLRTMLKEGFDLTELPGIGKDLAGKIIDIATTGHFRLLDTLKTKVPGQMGDMAALPGLGPKRLKLLYDKLKVRTLNDLRQAAKRGRHLDGCPLRQRPEVHALRRRSGPARLADAGRHHQHTIDR
jgi:DNA polymerase (family X)